MKSHEHFQRRINRSINAMEAKISYLHQGVNGLSEALRDFQTQISDFIMFTAENYADHEKRISNLEKIS